MRKKPARPTKQVPGCVRSGAREQESGKSPGGMRLAAALNAVAIRDNSTLGPVVVSSQCNVEARGFRWCNRNEEKQREREREREREKEGKKSREIARG